MSYEFEFTSTQYKYILKDSDDIPTYLLNFA